MLWIKKYNFSDIWLIMKTYRLFYQSLKQQYRLKNLNVLKIRGFMGISNYYQKFIREYALMLSTLKELCRQKNKKLILT